MCWRCQQAELSRKILERCEIAAPDALMAIRRRLASTWERIGKIRWKMNQFDAALQAFREAVAIEKRAFEDAKADISARSLLDHRYVRLGYWSAMRRDWAGVAATLIEREKLWPTNSDELTAIAMDYATLADKVGVAGQTPPLEAQNQRNRFVAEAARLRRVLKCASSGERRIAFEKLGFLIRARLAKSAATRAFAVALVHRLHQDLACASRRRMNARAAQKVDIAAA